MPRRKDVRTTKWLLVAGTKQMMCSMDSRFQELLPPFHRACQFKIIKTKSAWSGDCY